jgi:D-lyxose ketol-isomerase
MKRSFIDARIEAMLKLCDRHGVKLPPFALWGEAEYITNPDAARFIRARGLGWNVVEFKPGAFATDGLTLFTLRMGDWRELETKRVQTRGFCDRWADPLHAPHGRLA